MLSVCARAAPSLAFPANGSQYACHFRQTVHTTSAIFAERFTRRLPISPNGSQAWCGTWWHFTETVSDNGVPQSSFSRKRFTIIRSCLSPFSGKRFTMMAPYVSSLARDGLATKALLGLPLHCFCKRSASSRDSCRHDSCKVHKLPDVQGVAVHKLRVFDIFMI